MKVLIIGSGAREHAIAWKFSQSTRNHGIFCIPGNSGTEDFAVNLSHISPEDPKAVTEEAKKLGVNLVFVGPEVPLSLGVADALREAGIPVAGPGKDGAELESSKAFSKKFMEKHQIPTASAKIFTSANEVKAYLAGAEYPLVVKKSGLAAGKGVLESDNPAEATAFAMEHISQGPVVIEEFLVGYEVSIFVLADGSSYALLPPAADYKKAGENNSGPNTGGMGVVCPVPWFDTELMPEIEETIVKRSIEGLKADGIDYRGILYIGLMITESGPKVLEYNVRFGDPEAQALVPIIENDFCDLFEAVANGTLDEQEIRTSPLQSICVVVAAEGYPGPYEKGRVVQLPDIRLEARQFIFHASTTRKNGDLLTGGGRCFSVVGTGTELLKARNRCYELASKVNFDGAWYRKDIGNRVFGSHG